VNNTYTVRTSPTDPLKTVKGSTRTISIAGRTSIKKIRKTLLYT